MQVKLIEWFDEHWYKVELDNDEVIYIPSVTTKLQSMPKPFLARWRGDVGNREADLRMNEAGQKGTRIHYAASVLAKQGTVVFNPYNRPTYTQEEINDMQIETGKEVFVLQDQDEMWQVAKFKAWLDEVKPEIVAWDKNVYDIEENEAGTIDFLFKIKEGFYNVAGKDPLALEGGYYVVDLKSSKQTQNEHFLQLATYIKMCAKHEVNEKEMQGGLLIYTNALKTKKGIEGLNTKLLHMRELDDYYSAYKNVAAIWERYNKNAHPRMLEFPSLITLREDVNVSNDNENL